MRAHFLPLQAHLLAFSGWTSRRQQEVIKYLVEENRVLREQIGDRRLQLSDHQRRRLAAKGKRLGRAVLRQVAAQGTPTTVDLSGNGISFAAGQSYGLLVTTSNGQVVEYTPGAPTTYSGTHCDLTTNGGTLYPFQFLFADRQWNGTLHTEVLPPTGPTLALSGPCPGATTLTVTHASPGGAVAFAYAFTQGAWVLPGGPACVGTLLPLLQPVLLGTRPVDATGTATFSGNAPAVACGTISVAALDLATCTPTAAVAL